MSKKSGPPRAALPDVWSARLRAVDGRTGYPYLSDALFSLVPVMTDEVDTLAVDRWGRLYVNPSFFGRCTADQGAAVLIHEVWHPLLKHFDRADRLGPRPEERDIVNVAQDCEINIKDDLAGRLPGDCCLPAKFGLPDRGLFEEYYHLLKRDHPELLLPPQGRAIVVHAHGPNGDGPSQGDGGGPRPSPSSKDGASSKGRGVGGGRCGSCAHGQPQDYELPAPGEADAGGKRCDVPGVSPAKWEVVIRTTAQKVLEHSRSQGSVPGGWVRWAEEILTPAIDWRKALPQVVQGMLGRGLGHTWTDYRKISRRQHPCPRILKAATVNALPNVDVVLDTSGSMSDRMIAQGIAEVGGILAALGYAVKVNVHPTDSTAAECQKVFRPDQIRAVGGGGTGMGEGLKAVADRAEREPYDRPSLVVVITDCHTPWPEAAP